MKAHIFVTIIARKEINKMVWFIHSSMLRDYKTRGPRRGAMMELMRTVCGWKGACMELCSQYGTHLFGWTLPVNNEAVFV